MANAGMRYQKTLDVANKLEAIGNEMEQLVNSVKEDNIEGDLADSYTGNAANSLSNTSIDAIEQMVAGIKKKVQTLRDEADRQREAYKKQEEALQTNLSVNNG